MPSSHGIIKAGVLLAPAELRMQFVSMQRLQRDRRQMILPPVSRTWSKMQASQLNPCSKLKQPQFTPEAAPQTMADESGTKINDNYVSCNKIKITEKC